MAIQPRATVLAQRTLPKGKGHHNISITTCQFQEHQELGLHFDIQLGALLLDPSIMQDLSSVSCLALGPLSCISPLSPALSIDLSFPLFQRFQLSLNFIQRSHTERKLTAAKAF